MRSPCPDTLDPCLKSIRSCNVKIQLPSFPFGCYTNPIYRSGVKSVSDFIRSAINARLSMVAKPSMPYIHAKDRSDTELARLKRNLRQAKRADATADPALEEAIAQSFTGNEELVDVSQK